MSEANAKIRDDAPDGAVPSGERSLRAGSAGEQSAEPRMPGEQSAGEETLRERWWVLLDAAKACGSCPPDLRRHPADFVVCLTAALQVTCLTGISGHHDRSCVTFINGPHCHGPFWGGLYVTGEGWEGWLMGQSLV